MTQKLLSAVLGILVVLPNTAMAQDAPNHELSRMGEHRLPPLKVHRSGGQDSNKNGTVIGAAIGAAAGAFLGAGLASIDESSDGIAGPVIVMAALGAGAGAGIGYVVDNAFQRQVTYRIPVSRNVAIQPSAGVDKRAGAVGARAGLSAAVRW